VGEFIEFISQFRPSDEYTGALANDGGVNNLNGWLPNLQQSLNSVGKDQWQYIDQSYNQVVSWMPTILQNFGVLPTNQTNPSVKRQYTTETNRLINEAQQARKALSDATAAHQTEVTELQQELADLTERLAATETQLAIAEAAAKNKLTEQVESHEKAFGEEAEAREEAFEAEAEARAEAAKTELEDFKNRATAQQEELAQKADDLLARLTEYEQQSEALVDSTSRNAIAGDYGAWADAQGRQAFRWTMATIGFAVATAGVLLFLLLHVKAAEASSTSYIVFKTSIGFVMLAVAGYCASQAAQHRHEERTAKRLHLDLAALEPFLKQVENPEELRTEIANRVFAPERADAESRQAPFIQFGRGFSLDQLLNFVNAVRDKTP
jgi:chemotaxis protein histidine kinase CheA